MSEKISEVEPKSAPGTPEIMGADDSHRTMRRVLAEKKPCKILDACCGQGALTGFLRDQGWEVEAADIHPDNFAVEGVHFTAADFNKTLPFEDNSFDAVVFANAIHRLWNAAGTIEEFFRIIKPGGHLYINANNFCNIATRLRYLLYGNMEYRPPGQGYELVPEARVRIHLSYLTIENSLRAAGFEVEKLHAASVRRNHRLLAPVSFLVRLASRCLSSDKQEMNYLDRANSSAVLGGGYYTFIESRKPD